MTAACETVYLYDFYLSCNDGFLPAEWQSWPLISWSGEEKQLGRIVFKKNKHVKRKIVCKRSEITTIIVIIELGVLWFRYRQLTDVLKRNHLNPKKLASITLNGILILDWYRILIFDEFTAKVFFCITSSFFYSYYGLNSRLNHILPPLGHPSSPKWF